jgi:hypothetical protein
LAAVGGLVVVVAAGAVTLLTVIFLTPRFASADRLQAATAEIAFSLSGRTAASSG